MTLAQKYMKKIFKSEGNYAECDARESDDCLGAIWPHGERDTDGYWLDVFKDGSSIECTEDGLCSLSAAETKRVAGRWADYKEIKDQITPTVTPKPVRERTPNPTHSTGHDEGCRCARCKPRIYKTDPRYLADVKEMEVEFNARRQKEADAATARCNHTDPKDDDCLICFPVDDQPTVTSEPLTIEMTKTQMREVGIVVGSLDGNDLLGYTIKGTKLIFASTEDYQRIGKILIERLDKRAKELDIRPTTDHYLLQWTDKSPEGVLAKKKLAKANGAIKAC